MRIYDCFMFFNEIDLLRIRISELAPVVDVFVIVESNVDHRGKPRETIFESVRTSLDGIDAEIRYIVAEPPSDITHAWSREHFQRNVLADGLRDVQPQDLVIISDVDEIPRRETISSLPQIEIGDIVSLEMRLHYYGLNWYDHYTPWRAARIVSGATLEFLAPTEIRLAVPSLFLPNAGWHFSYFYPKNDAVEKLTIKAKSFAHSEFDNPRFLNRKYLELCMKGGLGWCAMPRFSRKFHYREIDMDYPHEIQADASQRFIGYQIERSVPHTIVAWLAHTYAKIVQPAQERVWRLVSHLVSKIR